MVNKEREHCGGCGEGPPNPQALCRTFNHDGSCPCSYCVVKAMCVEECSEFDDWYLLDKGRVK